MIPFMVGTRDKRRKDWLLHEDDVLRLLPTQYLGRELILVRTCTSTNELALKLAAGGRVHGCTVLASEQTQGRGRNRREWYSPVGGIWMSTIVRPEDEILRIEALPLVCALSVALAIRGTLNLPALVRWPNDVILGDRKVAGTLVESKNIGNQTLYAALGIGINSNFVFPADSKLRNEAITLLETMGRPVDNAQLISSVLTTMERNYKLLSISDDHQLLSLMKEVDWSHERRVVVTTPSRTVSGRFEGYASIDVAEIRLEGGSKTRIPVAEIISVLYPSS